MQNKLCKHEEDHLKLMDMAEGPHNGVHGSILCEAAALSSLQQVLLSLVVGMVVDGPGATKRYGFQIEKFSSVLQMKPQTP